MVPERRAGRAGIAPQASHRARAARARVALLIGCGARVFRPAIVAAAVRVLEENDLAVELVPDGMCCGALAHHEGDVAEAAAVASVLATHVEASCFDYVVTAAAGCRAALGEAAHLSGRDADGADSADRLSEKSREICELLVELGFRAPRGDARLPREIAYHDACHLLHAARVAEPARAVLAAAAATVVELGENAICCGSAGTYNLVHPLAADALGRRKSELIKASGCREVAVANLGCILQMERSLAMGGGPAAHRIAHPVEYLAEAYERERSRA